MKIENSFTVPLPVEEAWPVLLDVRRIVPCMPGAEIVEIVDDTTYKGKVSVRLGPVMLAFAGKAAFAEVDEAGRCARLKASGADTKGRGGANADVVFSLAPSTDGSAVTVVTDLQLSGSIAQYGRATGMIEDVAAQLVEEFASCLRQMLGSQPPALSADDAAMPTADGLEMRAAPSATPISAGGFAFRLLLRRLSRLWSRLRSA